MDMIPREKKTCCNHKEKHLDLVSKHYADLKKKVQQTQKNLLVLDELIPVETSKKIKIQYEKNTF